MSVEASVCPEFYVGQWVMMLVADETECRCISFKVLVTAITAAVLTPNRRMSSRDCL